MKVDEIVFWEEVNSICREWLNEFPEKCISALCTHGSRNAKMLKSFEISSGHSASNLFEDIIRFRDFSVRGEGARSKKSNILKDYEKFLEECLNHSDLAVGKKFQFSQLRDQFSKPDFEFLGEIDTQMTSQYGWYYKIESKKYKLDSFVGFSKMLCGIEFSQQVSFRGSSKNLDSMRFPIGAEAIFGFPNQTLFENIDCNKNVVEVIKSIKVMSEISLEILCDLTDRLGKRTKP